MRTLCSGGYSRHQYSAVDLRARAQMLAAIIPRLLKEYNADCIVVTGKSGHSVAFATMMLIDYPLCVVRKETDQSHGYSVEGRDGLVVQRYLILDDFIASGATVDKCIKSMELGHPDMHCAGVVEYDARNSEMGSTYWVAQYEQYIPVIKPTIRG